MPGFFLGFKIANMGIWPMAGYDRHKPAAGFTHLGRELWLFLRHGQTSAHIRRGFRLRFIVSTASACARQAAQSARLVMRL
jgi:hypothetical protein